MHSELIPTGPQKVVAGERNGALEPGCIGLIPTPYYKVTSTESER
jgi:hypothetical protein